MITKSINFIYIMIDERWMELKVDGKNISGRSYHSSVTYKDNLYIYGGYDV